MKGNSFRLIFWNLFLIAILSIGCNKDSYMEGLGFTSDVGSTPSAQSGRITLYCTNSNILFCSNGLEIRVNSQTKDWILDYSVSAPSCGSNTIRAVTLVLAPGSYSFSISGTGTSCPRYTFSRTISAGACLVQKLN